MTDDSADLAFLRRAIELSLAGRGRVEPNPMVGAVVVRDGSVLGEGFHRAFGGPHAEVEALAACAGSAAGATVYVSLEPCCHFGKTPPCTDALIAAGVARVVYAIEDPFPKVAGGGRRALEAAGVRVVGGLLRSEAVRANAPYFKRLATGRPYVIAKWAQSLDGKMATASGSSKWITGEPARLCAHRLRDRVDAVLVGIGTASTDDPLLTARIPDGRNPRRVVLDPRLRLPLDSQLVRTARRVPLWVVCRRALASTPAADALSGAGAEVLPLLDDPDNDLGPLLDELGRRGVTNLLVEGGPKVLTSFLAGKLVDEVQVFIAPKLVGGSAAPTAFEGAGAAAMADAFVGTEVEVERLGDDVRIAARLTDPLIWLPECEVRN